MMLAAAAANFIQKIEHNKKKEMNKCMCWEPIYLLHKS